MSHDEQEWRSWPVERREQEYSPSRCVDSLAPLLAAYAARSREAEQHFLCRKDLRWGEAEDETFDFFQRLTRMPPCCCSSTAATGRSCRKTNRSLQRQIV